MMKIYCKRTVGPRRPERSSVMQRRLAWRGDLIRFLALILINQFTVLMLYPF
jgi:hypothetical protein